MQINIRFKFWNEHHWQRSTIGVKFCRKIDTTQMLRNNDVSIDYDEEQSSHNVKERIIFRETATHKNPLIDNFCIRFDRRGSSWIGKAEWYNLSNPPPSPSNNGKTFHFLGWNRRRNSEKTFGKKSKSRPFREAKSTKSMSGESSANWTAVVELWIHILMMAVLPAPRS